MFAHFQTSNEAMPEGDDDDDDVDDETEEGEVGNVDSRSSSIMNDQTTSKGEKGNDLLEGISDEDLVSSIICEKFKLPKIEFSS